MKLAAVNYPSLKMLSRIASVPFLLVAGLASLLAPAAKADDSISWSASCKTASAQFEVRFHSRSNDMANDDMTVSVRQGKSTLRVRAMKQHLFYPSKITDGGISLCSDITGVTLAGGDILLLFRRDDRPGADHLAAILLDQGARHVLDASDDLGEMNTSPELHSKEGAVELQMIRKWAPLIPNYEDQPVNGWMVLAEENHKIRWKWRDPE